ncbi:MAG TPA: hypothetical protein VLN59_16625, partial [Burkholderiales bacterium]|nr:hypothetical protein [Burkholderiales bacterium]
APALGVRICGGYALGPFGDEIFVPDSVPLDLAYCAQPPAVACDPKYPVVQPALTTPILVMIRYAECPTRPMRTLPAGCGCDETACEYSRLRDGFEVQCMLKPKPTKETKLLADAPTMCEIERNRKDKPPQDKLPKCPEPTDPWVLLAEVTLVTETGKDPSLAPEKIDNGVRTLVYSTAAIQQQVILSCCK